MHAYLIVGQSSDYVNKITSTKFEFPLLKIADVRELNRFTRLKLTEKTAIIIRDFDLASEETQNAFLKALEEPQENLTYILTVTNVESVLETVVSRCEIIEIPNSKLQIPDNTKIQIDKFIDSEIGERFLVTSKITKRDEAIEFMKNLIIVGHSEMTNFDILESALLTLRNLEANGNVILQLTNFVLNSSFR